MFLKTPPAIAGGVLMWKIYTFFKEILLRHDRKIYIALIRINHE